LTSGVLLTRVRGGDSKPDSSFKVSEGGNVPRNQFKTNVMKRHKNRGGIIFVVTPLDVRLLTFDFLTFGVLLKRVWGGDSESDSSFKYSEGEI
jgi:hypothetical protein